MLLINGFYLHCAVWQLHIKPQLMTVPSHARDDCAMEEMCSEVSTPKCVDGGSLANLGRPPLLADLMEEVGASGNSLISPVLLCARRCTPPAIFRIILPSTVPNNNDQSTCGAVQQQHFTTGSVHIISGKALRKPGWSDQYDGKMPQLYQRGSKFSEYHEREQLQTS